MSPYVALGIDARAARHRFDPTLGDPAVRGTSSSQWLGVFARGYFLIEGGSIPYVQAGFGRGTVETTYGSAADVEVSGTGPATMVGAGFDARLLPTLKLGPSLVYRWVFLSELRVCQAWALAARTVLARWRGSRERCGVESPAPRGRSAGKCRAVSSGAFARHR